MRLSLEKKTSKDKTLESSSYNNLNKILIVFAVTFEYAFTYLVWELRGGRGGMKGVREMEWEWKG
jgi:hypothetical protein